ncbi:M-phase inducer phosphatase 3 isoform X12 [Pteropus vampyrus]|uniref:M-phase inducer phosphatase 3 isoform X12 n=1 Tax=Pteropus vampyrus TaxID=132908 RepID=A0A6P6CJT5_PTEVA|nr:M-phase inducer phosphatase 3 isoform X12 [Pteropus vampyrus]
MSAELVSSREEGSPGLGPSFRSHQRKILNLLLERDTSFTICPDLPKTPVDKLFGDSANVNILFEETPKRCLDLSNLSSGELSATRFTTLADLDETGREKRGHLDSSGPQEIQLARINHHQHLVKCSPAQVLCSTPNALDHGDRKKDAICSSSTNKENENNTFKPLESWTPRNLNFQKRRGGPYVSPLSLLDNGNLVKSEMKYLGSPITAVPKLDKNPEQREDQAKEILGESMEFSLEDQEEAKDLCLKKVSLCDINITQMLEEDPNQGYLTGDFSKVCALPTVSGRHQDLKYINPETGALNLYSQEELYNFFLKMPIVPLDTQKRIIIVFYCEFSERGPRMCRSLREEDRALNQYPALYYPELYILKGGYRDFFPEYKELCEPQSYCPMHHQDHKADLLRCRNQSKAWEEERQLQEQIALLVKDVNP